MNATIRIWLTALIIQPVIFCFFLLWAAIFIIPFEIAGSIPGIILFGGIMKLLSALKVPYRLKWVLAVLSGILLALGCSYMLVSGLNGSTDLVDKETYLLLIPAPLAALLSIIINRSAVEEYLDTENRRKEVFQ